MSLTSFKEALLAEARTQAAQVKAEYEAQSHAEQERIAALSRQLEEDITTHAERQGEQAARRIHQEAELSVRSDILIAKQEELQATFAAFVDELLALDDKSVRELLQGLLAVLPPEPGELIAGEVHRTALAPLAKQQGRPLAEETIPHDGGFIYRAGKLEIKMTLRYLAEQLFSKQRATIASELFS